MAEDPVEGDPALASQLPGDLERVRRGRVDPGAVIAAVDLEPGVQSRPREGSGGVEIVHYHAHRDAGVGQDAARVSNMTRIDGECPGEIADAGPGERFGLNRGGYGEPVRALLELQSP